jgi:hypothetical protein
MLLFLLLLFSEADLLNLDMEKHFLITQAKYYDVVLYPGQMLFIPRWMWHWVGAVSDTAAAEWERNVNADANESSCSDSHSTCYFTSVKQQSDLFSWSVNFWWGARIIK